MNYYHRKASNWQALVNLAACTSILLGAACIAFAATASPLLAISSAVGAVIAGFITAGEYETVKALRRKGDISEANAQRRERQEFRNSIN
jgi:cytosine/uracil/thiamine/allantoin permease